MVDSPSRGDRLLHKAVLTAALMSLPAALALRSDDEATVAVGGVLNWISWGVLLLEIIVIMARAEDPLAALRDRPLEVAIVAVTVPVASSGAPLLVSVRLLRLLPMLKRRPIEVVFSPRGLRDASVATGVFILITGWLFWRIERLEQDVSAQDGIWWSIVTVTTVGYGDITPETAAGRILGMLVIVVGVSFVALVTGALAERFLSRRQTVAEQGGDPADELAEIRVRLEQLEGRLRADRGEP